MFDKIFTIGCSDKQTRKFANGEAVFCKLLLILIGKPGSPAYGLEPLLHTVFNKVFILKTHKLEWVENDFGEIWAGLNHRLAARFRDEYSYAKINLLNHILTMTPNLQGDKCPHHESIYSSECKSLSHQSFRYLPSHSQSV